MKPLDLSKFRTNLTKSINGISIGFNDPKTWISTGCYALNYLISSDFYKGVPLGKSTVLAGESGSGKSYLSSGNLVREAQQKGVFVVLIDTENALDESWLRALDVDTSPEKLMRISCAMIDDVAKIISDFMKDYKANYASEKPEDRPKVMFVIDSLGMLMTPTDVAQFEAGEMKGDMGRKPKALKALVTNVTNMFGEYDVGLVCTNHSYASQDMFDPDPKMSGGCLVAGSKLFMADGTLKEIQDMAIGDRVATRNGVETVTKLWEYEKPTITLELEDGKTIECSHIHQFLVQNPDGSQEWVEAQNLMENQELVAVD